MPRPARPWFRLHAEIADNPKFHELPDRLVKPLVICLALACTNNPRGFLPSMKTVAFKMRVKEEKAKGLVAALMDRHWIDFDGARYVMHDWEEWQKDRDVTPAKRRGSGDVNHGNGDIDHAREEEEKEEETETDQEKEAEEEKEAPARRNIFVLYDSYMGRPAITPTMRDLLIEAELRYPPDCIKHCFERAAASSDGRRNWSFVESILQRHERDGCDDKRRPTGTPAAAGNSPAAAGAGDAFSLYGGVRPIYVVDPDGTGQSAAGVNS